MMLQLFRTLNLPYLARRWERTLLIIASISLGVATLVSTQMLSNCLASLVFDTTTPLAGADLYITNGEIGIVPELGEELKKASIPGIDRVVPFVIERVDLPNLDRHVGILVGIDLQAGEAAKTNDFLKFKITPIPQNPLTLKSPAAISRGLYEERERLGIKPSEPLVVRYANTRHELTPVAVLDVDPSSPAASFARNLIAMQLNQAMAVLRPTVAAPAYMLAGGAASAIAQKADRLTRIDIFTQPNADKDAVRKELVKIVAGRSEILTPEVQKKSTDDVIGGIQTSFNVCSIGALIVGLFLVYNALAVSVAERRRDIGILRSLGSSRWQLASLFAREAALLGFVGALLGIPLGIIIAEAALSLFRDELSSVLLSGQIALVRVDFGIWIEAIIAGMGTCLLAAMIPTWQAATDQPAEVVRRSPNHVAKIWRVIQIGTVLFMVGGGVTSVLLRNSLPARWGNYGGMIVVLAGLFLSLPLLIRILAWFTSPFLRAILGIESRLAADNLTLTPGRTGIVVGALASGVSLMFQTAGVGHSNEEPVMAWIDQVIQADAYVFWGNIATANSSSTPMESNVGAKLKEAVPEIDIIVGVHFYRPKFNNTIIYCLAIDATNYHDGITARLPSGPHGLDLFKKLPTGNYCVISDNFAIKHNVKEGDTIEIPGPRGMVPLQVIGRGLDYTWNKGTMFVDRTKFVELFEDDYVDIYHIFFKKGVDKKATFEKLEAVAGKMELLTKDRAFLRAYLVDVIDKLYQIAYVQQVIVGTTASLGVVTALLISVLQRRRELGLLRAVGASRSQILKTVLAEAVIMGILGAIFGFALGLPMEWFLIRIVIFEESGFYFPLIIPWKELLGITAVSISIATLAGIIPAIQAMRMRITDAIAYE